MSNTKEVKQFSIHRFLHITKINIQSQMKGIIIALSIIMGIHFIIYLSTVFSGAREEIHSVFFLNTFFIAGLIAASLIFKDYHVKDRNYFFLLLPASRFEKYVSRFLITTVGYVLGAIIVYFVYSLIAMGISFALFRRSFGVFNPFTASLWKMIGGYIVAHAIFFFGSVYFKKAAFLKTLLAVIVVVIFYLIFTALISAATAVTWLDDLLPFAFRNFNGLGLPNSGPVLQFLEVMSVIARVFIYGIVTPGLWLLGFLRFKEIEAR